MKWTGPAEWLKREARAGDRLPFDRHIEDATIRLRDGALMRTLQIGGLEFETADSAQLQHAQQVREVLLRSVLDARFVIYHHVVRRRVGVASGGEFTSPFCAAVGERWDQRLAERALFVNDQFLTVVRRPARGKTGWPERLQRRFGGRGGDEHSAFRELEAATTALLAALQPYSARLLSSYCEPAGELSEPLEFLSSIYNGEMRPVILPTEGTDLGHHIPYRRLSFGLDAIEMSGADGRSFAGLLSIKEYPSETRPGLIDDILRLPYELVLTETFAVADRQIARERIDLALRRQKAGDEDSGTERREMLAARDALNAGQVGFGDHHLSLLVRAGDLPGLDKAMAGAAAAIADIGAIAVREDVNLEPLFWGQFPGNEAYIVRRALISTANAAGFISLHGFPVGKPSDNHWGDAVTVLETTSSTPYFFNFHEGDLGHFSIIGPSRSQLRHRREVEILRGEDADRLALAHSDRRRDLAVALRGDSGSVLAATDDQGRAAARHRRSRSDDREQERRTEALHEVVIHRAREARLPGFIDGWRCELHRYAVRSDEPRPEDVSAGLTARYTALVRADEPRGARDEHSAAVEAADIAADDRADVTRQIAVDRRLEDGGDQSPLSDRLTRMVHPCSCGDFRTADPQRHRVIAPSAIGSQR
jgi:hypothetical protein